MNKAEKVDYFRGHCSSEKNIAICLKIKNRNIN